MNETKTAFVMYTCGCRSKVSPPPAFCPVHGERMVYVETVDGEDEEDADWP